MHARREAIQIHADLENLGCQRFVVDMSHFAAGSVLTARVLAAMRQDTPLEGTSSFNYLQEMV